MRYRIFAAIGLLAAASPAWADAWDFILVNNSGKEVTTIELAPSGTTTWQPNTLYEDSKPKNIKAGQRSTIHFDKPGSQCKWDVKATFTDSTSAVFGNLNLCDASFVTISFKGTTPVAVGS